MTRSKQPMDTAPVVSVVIASYQSQTTIEHTLRSLTNQQDVSDYEVIVVDSSEDEATAEVVNRFPRVRLIRVRGRRYPGEARNIGVRQSHGEILAFTDADCSTGPGWVAAIRKLHYGDRRIIGGTVANGNPDRIVGWVYYFCKFHNWLPCESARHLKEIPTTCLTMHRAVFERFGPFLHRCYSSDSTFNWTAFTALGPAYLTRELEVRHINYTRPATVICKLYQHGRDFARQRVRAESWVRRHVLLYVAGSPLLPIVLFGKVLRNVTASSVDVRKFVAVAPLVFLGLTVWSIGEVTGYLGHLRMQHEQAS